MRYESWLLKTKVHEKDCDKDYILLTKECPCANYIECLMGFVRIIIKLKYLGNNQWT